jgi:hypothetical protein
MRAQNEITINSVETPKKHLKIHFLEKCQKEYSQLSCFGLVQPEKSW